VYVTILNGFCGKRTGWEKLNLWTGHVMFWIDHPSRALSEIYGLWFMLGETLSFVSCVTMRDSSLYCCRYLLRAINCAVSKAVKTQRCRLCPHC